MRNVRKRSQKDVRTNIAARLKTLRENAGFLLAKDFCEKYGFDLRHYRQHEAGTHAILASEAIQYCAVLKVSVYYLMLGEEKDGRF